MRAALIVFAVCTIVFETSAVRSGIRNGIRSRRSYDKWLEIISQLSKRSGANGNSLSAFPIEFPFADKDGRYSALPLLVLPYPVPVPDHSSRGECSAKNHEFDVRLGNSQFAQEDYAVTMPGPVSSAYLIEVFKEQQPQAPELPPAVISPPPQIVYPSIQASRGYLPPQRDAQPSLPRFDRSMVLHGFLTVFKADYTEQYTVWYDANTAAARVEYHEGATSCYRMMMSNNRIKRSTMTTDRTTGQDSIVCGVTTPVRASGEDRQTPGLPDTEGFTFAGYKQEFGGQAEVWTREVQGGPGELGAAQGESLVFHHELLVHRRGDDFTVPLRSGRARSGSGRVAGLPPRAVGAPACRRLHCATQVSNNLYQGTRRQVEVWTREVQGGPGELGAAQGESLVYHHELLVHRRGDDFTVPLRSGRAGSGSERVAGLPPRAAGTPAWRRLHCATQVSNNLYQGTRRQVEVWTREVQGGLGELGAAQGESLVYHHELLVHRRGDDFTVPLRRQVEVWTREVQGGPGELGAAQGESLVYHHELLVHRRGDDFTVPLRYTVNIDSSVLGPQCDGYEHIYSLYQEKEHNDDEFRFSERQCDEKETLDPINKEHMARLDPIREFTLPTRASIHDELFAKFTKDFDRTYADADEEALRKNLLTQRTRFIASCNRQGATFSVGHNFLSDRLDEEISEILGVTFSAEAENNTLSFSSATGGSGSKQLPKEWDWRPKGAVSSVKSTEKLEAGGKQLPKEWDWRPKGAVSSVKFQGAACSSCWAFAVTGSVEGALFIKTKKLVELSVQALVDCSKSHGAHGCNKIGTWPVHAYNYVKDRGLPAVGDYAAYDEKDHECKAPPSEPTTHIEGGVDIPPNNIDALKTAIRYEAPAVLVVDAQAKSFISYKTGVLKDDRCKKGPKKKLNHAVLTVGWGEQNGEPHFIIKNSWSAVWGEGGYIRLHAPSNTCGVLTVPSFAKLQRPNIDKLPAGASNTDYDENRR
ncbi:hypothetical protein O0L34_g17788 [Tuta absoluta]|nr:hypothetical protein O0L34_g17788 [Tuta absoluta]